MKNLNSDKASEGEKRENLPSCRSWRWQSRCNPTAQPSEQAQVPRLFSCTPTSSQAAHWPEFIFWQSVQFWSKNLHSTQTTKDPINDSNYHLFCSLKELFISIYGLVISPSTRPQLSYLQVCLEHRSQHPEPLSRARSSHSSAFRFFWGFSSLASSLWTRQTRTQPSNSKTPHVPNPPNPQTTVVQGRMTKALLLGADLHICLY